MKRINIDSLMAHHYSEDNHSIPLVRALGTLVIDWKEDQVKLTAPFDRENIQNVRPATASV